MTALAAPAADHRKARAARFSIVSNSALIALKVVAGVLTGSVAIITEAVHSSIDLVASVVAYFSVRKAEEPADRSHPYGHEKVENLAAALEGVLIVLGAADLRADRALELVAQLVSALERGSARELHVKVDVSPAARPAGAQLVMSDHLARAVPVDRLADALELVLRQCLVDEDA